MFSQIVANLQKNLQIYLFKKNPQVRGPHIVKTHDIQESTVIFLFVYMSFCQSLAHSNCSPVCSMSNFQVKHKSKAKLLTC